MTINKCRLRYKNDKKTDNKSMVKLLQKYTKEQTKNAAVFNENHASKQQHFFIKFSLKISLKIIPNLHKKLRQNSTNFCLKFTAHSVRILSKNVMKKTLKNGSSFTPKFT